jgi:ABC-type branched-subunit amino acid transport system substrate-binding protein
VALLAATACGTTVDGVVADSAALDGGASLSVPSPGASGDTSLAGPDGAFAGDSPTGSAPIPGTSVAPDGSIVDSHGRVVSPAPGGAAGAVQGVGVTAKEIFVGITYQTNGDQANKALGVGAISQGDTKADAQAIVDDINAHGGVAGRKLVPVWFNYDVSDTRPYTVQDNAACAKFTQDNHVFAVLGTGITDNYTACATKAGAINLGSNIIDPDVAYFQRYPYYFGYDTVSQDRMMADEVGALVRLKYFTAWDANNGKPGGVAPVKVGIIGYDSPSWRTPLQQKLLPGLARAGIKVDPADVQLILRPDDNSQIPQAVAQVQSAVLKFRQDNVSHVIVLDANGSMMLQLLQNARGQHYYPRYGVNTATGMQALADTGAVDGDQFAGAVGLGWSPTLDLAAGKSDRYLGAATKNCLDVIEKRTGQRFSSTNAAAIALDYCDGLYLLRDAANRAGTVLNQQTARMAIESLGAAFKPAGVASSYFGPSQHDGLETGYDMRWDTDCSCSRYVSQHRIP